MQHWDQWHTGKQEPPVFIFKVSKVCQSSLERQIWEGVEIETSQTQRVINLKGEWGFNLPPNQATVFRGEIHDEDQEKGKKRQAGRPPEPPDPPDGGPQGEFGEQFRQRKRRRVEARRLRIMSAPVPSVLGTPEHQNGPGLDTSIIPVIPELTSAQSQV